MTDADIIFLRGNIRPGDCLLFNGSGVVNWIVKTKTWSEFSHVEIVHDRKGKTLASRNGLGVAQYDLDLTNLAAVLRPLRELDWQCGNYWFWNHVNGKPYGWLDLLQFINLDIPTDGLICSEFATMFYRACDFKPFAVDYPAKKVCPADFAKSPLLQRIWPS